MAVAPVLLVGQRTPHHSGHQRESKHDVLEYACLLFSPITPRGNFRGRFRRLRVFQAVHIRLGDTRAALSWVMSLVEPPSPIAELELRCAQEALEEDSARAVFFEDADGGRPRNGRVQRAQFHIVARGATRHRAECSALGRVHQFLSAGLRVWGESHLGNTFP